MDCAQVYRLTGRALIHLNQFNTVDQITQLLQCIRASRQDENISLCDDVAGACIRSCTNPELIDPLIKLLSNDINKIDAYILIGKLRSAYLLAINLNRVGDVTRVMEAAARTNQDKIKTICEMWLHKKANRS